MIRVLIVDDQPAFRTQLRCLLAAAGLDVVAEARTVGEAEEQAACLRPDLAVVDVMLPDINGLEGSVRLKALVPELRVILISAHRDQAHIFSEAAQAAGAEMFVQKDDLDLAVVGGWRAGVEHGAGPG